MELDPLDRHRPYHPTITWAAAGLVRKTECKDALCGYRSWPDDEPHRSNDRRDKEQWLEEQAHNTLLQAAIAASITGSRG